MKYKIIRIVKTQNVKSFYEANKKNMRLDDNPRYLMVSKSIFTMKKNYCSKFCLSKIFKIR